MSLDRKVDRGGDGMSVRNRIRRAREYLGLSVTELARLSGVGVNEIHYNELVGDELVDLILPKLAPVLHRPVEWLRGDAPDPQDDLAREIEKLGDADRVELTEFARYLSHRAQTRGGS